MYEYMLKYYGARTTRKEKSELSIPVAKSK